MLEAGRCRVTLVEMTNASERARAAANLMTQSDNPLPHAAQSSTPARFSPTAGRRAHDAAAVPCSPSIIRRASLPPSPAPSSSGLDTLQTPSLSAAPAARLPLAPPSLHRRHTCVSRTRVHASDA